MAHKNRIYVTKADGTKAPFDYNKIRRTCIRAGISKRAADTIANRILGQAYPGIRTKAIYKMVIKALAAEEGGHIIKHRYRLKESIMRMGPAGSQFEEYVAKILESVGFEINSLRSEYEGRCVKHEIDISAFSKASSKRHMIECKYHNLPGIFTGIKESLYTHARFLDLSSHFDAEMLVTNTKVSSDVIAYASCIGQDVLSWRYPPENSLEKLIEAHGLYPLTILPFSKNETRFLHESGITMAKDLLSKDAEHLSQRTGISPSRIRSMQDLARRIIS